MLLLGVAGGLILAFLWERDTLAGSDAFAYWTAVQRWLRGADIYQVLPDLYLPPTQGALPYAYAPWSLYLFLPWALLPWQIAFPIWRAVSVGLFVISAAWAYERRPLATALFVVILAPSIAANFDTGNVNVLIALAPFAAWLVSSRWGAVGWAIGTGLKFMPAPLLLFMPRSGWRLGLIVLGVIAVLTLATWPQTQHQLQIVFNYPRPLRIDYMILLWGLVPWLWLVGWPRWEARQRTNVHAPEAS